MPLHLIFIRALSYKCRNDLIPASESCSVNSEMWLSGVLVDQFICELMKMKIVGLCFKNLIICLKNGFGSSYIWQLHDRTVETQILLMWVHSVNIMLFLRRHFL